ncbi:hypothetical protein H312_01281 [Anncaliia algerae PRA339]|uniref:GINS subunit domain-containing protein n=1 Tax=Anncaliia algerae PRA339 TaxID=1288291 RepID=A0A059F258_9MICR|nr:hypothetical protein H312_01281 [Anncaliia algerae PRA339]
MFFLLNCFFCASLNVIYPEFINDCLEESQKLNEISRYKPKLKKLHVVDVLSIMEYKHNDLFTTFKSKNSPKNVLMLGLYKKIINLAKDRLLARKISHEYFKNGIKSSYDDVKIQENHETVITDFKIRLDSFYTNVISRINKHTRKSYSSEELPSDCYDDSS